MSYEKYYPNGWQSGETGGTPITPEALNHIEAGIINAYQAIRKAAPYNLLDNSDFRNPVNQRGQASYTGAFGYCIDRWTRSANATVNVTSGGVKIVAASAGNGMFSQNIEAKPDMVGKKFTLAYCTGSGVIGCVTFPVNTITVSTNTKLSGNITMDGNTIGYVYMLPGGIMQVQFLVYSSKTVTIQWAALYEGEYTTETLPEYKSKGYAAELAECMRYYQKLGSLQIPATPYSATSILLTPPCKIEMRLKPTLTVTDMSHLRCGGKTISTFPTYTVAAFGGSPESPNFTMTFVSEHGLPLANAGFLYMAGELLADL